MTYASLDSKTITSSLLMVSSYFLFESCGHMAIVSRRQNNALIINLILPQTMN